MGTVTWPAGNPGDGWYEMTAAWVDLLNGGGVHFAFAAGGGEENLTSVAAGRGELGMSIEVVAAAAYNAGLPFTELLRNLRRLGTDVLVPYNLLVARTRRSTSSRRSEAARSGSERRRRTRPTSSCSSASSPTTGSRPPT